ncbi:hypothetical protein [Clostridium cylindrosporum]|uniref:Apea-like HEPN domain-containing protein n=1 Tax=Clostridium cylindrosporum DSM 605 TaxID=1121307 RepID=A0A0J8DAV9_CLOCY|nr:hypothetical protein [Clostridium cylindrosporum]KMT22987.1 hypothetical protein CLCY_7c00340 [Clostridium cylindrosporum DSM 605]
MHKFKLSVPLTYNNISKYNSYASGSSIVFKIQDYVEFNTQYEFERNEEFINEDIKIILEGKEEHIYLVIQDIYANDKDEVYNSFKDLINRVCIILTFSMQSKVANTNYFHSKFTYNPSDINIEILDGYLHSFGYKDTLICTINNRVDNNEFKDLFVSMNKSDSFKFIMEAYYRSFGELEDRSRYYNLFTIIEYIEENYKDKSNSLKLFNKSFTDEVSKVFLEKLSEEYLGFSEDTINDLISGFKSYLGKITNKSRAEKLYNIITQYFGIKKVICNFEKKSYEITCEKIRSFINFRNKLFHAKSFTEEELKMLRSITDELMGLCDNIIYKLHK